MLADRPAVATVATKNLQAASQFYEEKLGLQRDSTEGDQVITYRSGNALLNVYRSDFAGTNKATAVTWGVGDELDDIVASLKSKGVQFEHYDMPDIRREGDIHVCGDMRVVWFKDPDGNILNLINQ